LLTATTRQKDLEQIGQWQLNFYASTKNNSKAKPLMVILFWLPKKSFKARAVCFWGLHH
jgi:hypothetical protein